MIVGLQPEPVEARDQRGNPPVPFRITQPHLAIDDGERVRIARHAGDKTGPKIKHSFRASAVGVPSEPRMIHLHPMTKHEAPPLGTNAPQPVRSLRDWLDHLAARSRLAVLPPNIGLKFELAAYAKRLDGQRATMFPKPGGHAIPVVSGLVSDRGWMAEAMGVEPGEMLAAFQQAASH